MTALVILELFVIAILAVLVVGLLRSHAEILRRLHELGAGVYDDNEGAAPNSGLTTEVSLGARAPVIGTRPGVPEPRADETPAYDLSGLSPTGASSAVGVLGTQHSTLLAFLSSGCGTCAGFWRAFADFDETSLPGADTRLVIVTKGPESESPATVQTLAPPTVTTVMSSEAYRDYAVPVSPYFILVNGPDGRIIGEGAAATWPQVSNLLHQALADAGHQGFKDASPQTGASNSPGRKSPTPSRLNGPSREARADVELLVAGILPGHPSLYPNDPPRPGDA